MPSPVSILRLDVLCLFTFNLIHSRQWYRHVLECARGHVQDIVDNKKLQMRGIVGLYAANAVGDDIEIYKDDSRTEVLCRSVQ